MTEPKENLRQGTFLMRAHYPKSAPASSLVRKLREQFEEALYEYLDRRMVPVKPEDSAVNVLELPDQLYKEYLNNPKEFRRRLNNGEITFNPRKRPRWPSEPTWRHPDTFRLNPAYAKGLSAEEQKKADATMCATRDLYFRVSRASYELESCKTNGNTRLLEKIEAAIKEAALPEKKSRTVNKRKPVSKKKKAVTPVKTKSKKGVKRVRCG